MYRNWVSLKSHKDLQGCLHLRICSVHVDSTSTLHGMATLVLRYRPRPNQEFILASGLPSSSLRTIELVRSWLITRFSRQLYTLAQRWIQWYTMNGNLSVGKLQRKMFNATYHNMYIGDLLEVVGGCLMLSHPEWQNKASCATCVRESKRKQYVPCPTYSEMAISLRRKQRVDSLST